MNVMVGERYKQVIDEILLYALGFWGEEESSSIDPDIKDRVLARPRAHELQNHVVEDVTIDELRRSVDGEGISEDELLLRIFAGTDATTRFRTSPKAGPWFGQRTNWISLMEQLGQTKNFRRLRVVKGESSFYAERSP